MKKLIIAAAAVLVAVVTQAAQVTWAATQINFTSNQADATKYMAFLVDASKYEDIADAVSKVYAGDSSGIMRSVAGVSQTVSSVDYVKVSETKADLPAGYTAGNYYSVFTLIYDGSVGEGATAKNYIAIDNGSKGISTAGLMTATSGKQNTTAWTAVPEPTSGLLMLLGMAGLALKRKRA